MYKRRFSWDSEKDAKNLKKHGLDFSTASRAFADPFAMTEHDRIENGELRWRTLALLEGRVVLVIAHTCEDDDECEHIRIISAREADRKERKYYDQSRL